MWMSQVGPGLGRDWPGCSAGSIQKQVVQGACSRPFCFQGRLATSGDSLGCHDLGRVCCWHLVGGGRGCCSAPCSTRMAENEPVPDAEAKKPCTSAPQCAGIMQVQRGWVEVPDAMT